MNFRDIPMPPAVAALPRDPRGYPVFYMVQPPPGQPADFRVQNMAHKERAALRRLCGICGRSLGRRAWFLGGPMCLGNHTFGEPPMHRECLDYALQVCPFLTTDIGYNIAKAEKAMAEGQAYDPYAVLKKPPYMVLLEVAPNDYKPFSPDGKVLLFNVARWQRLEWRDNHGKPTEDTHAVITNDFGTFIVCFDCGSVSFNTNDVAERYCGRCHRHHSEVAA